MAAAVNDFNFDVFGDENEDEEAKVISTMSKLVVPSRLGISIGSLYFLLFLNGSRCCFLLFFCMFFFLFLLFFYLFFLAS